MADHDGVSDFFALHAALAARHAPHAVLVAFDIVHLDGEDLRGRGREREAPRHPCRTSCAGGIPGCNSPKPSKVTARECGGQCVAWALRASSRSVVDRATFPARPTPGAKTKCTETGHFAVLGYDRQWRSLRLARLVESDLVSCGSAGSGLSVADVRQIRAVLDAGHAVVATVEYRGFTPAGELRHPVIRGWQRG